MMQAFDGSPASCGELDQTNFFVERRWVCLEHPQKRGRVRGYQKLMSNTGDLFQQLKTFR
jgi:hypothetical protein